MSSPSGRRRGGKTLAEREADAADEQAAAMLADDAGGEWTKNWQVEILEGRTIKEILSDTTLVTYCNVRLGNQTARLAAEYAHADQISREGWIRRLVAEECARRSGSTVADMLWPIREPKTYRQRKPSGPVKLR